MNGDANSKVDLLELEAFEAALPVITMIIGRIVKSQVRKHSSRKQVGYP